MKPQTLFLLISALSLLSFAHPEKEFKIFQFPQNQIPRIDGDFSDWEMVPDSYTIGTNELKNTKIGEGIPIDPKDFDMNAKWLWDFGDGESSDEKNPVHQYKQGKEWTVILTVEDPAGKSVCSKVCNVVTQ